MAVAGHPYSKPQAVAQKTRTQTAIWNRNAIEPTEYGKQIAV